LCNIAAISREGYTGHDAMGGVSMGLNHMNGRVQDAITGRFLSPDPNIPDPGNPQSFNRYSYVNNNPLTFVDPTGFDDTSLPIIGNAGGGSGGAGTNQSGDSTNSDASSSSTLSTITILGELSTSVGAEGIAALADGLGVVRGAQATAATVDAVYTTPSSDSGLQDTINVEGHIGAPAADYLGAVTLGAGIQIWAADAVTASEIGTSFHTAFYTRFNIVPNLIKFYTSVGNTVPDLVASNGLGDLKSSAYVYIDEQLEAQLAVANEASVSYFQIVSPTSTVSGQVVQAVAQTGGEVVVFDAEAGVFTSYDGGEVSAEFLEFLAALIAEE
jgi:RHS repeat-associated protein